VKIVGEHDAVNEPVWDMAGTGAGRVGSVPPDVGEQALAPIDPGYNFLSSNLNCYIHHE
jgi:hypothetical protein